MKLYVWEDPIGALYGWSWLIIVASNLREARKLAFDQHTKRWAYGRNNDKIPPKFDLGKPDRVLPIPCAEWHIYES